MAAVSEAEAELDAAEKADNELPVTERAKIELFDYASVSRPDVVKFLASDMRAAATFRAEYKPSVSNGEVAPASSEKILRKGC